MKRGELLMKRCSKRAFGGLLAGVMMFSLVISTTTMASKAESGKVYTANFMTLENLGFSVQDKVNGMLFGNDTIKIVSPTDYAYFHDSSHGLALKEDDQIQVSVAGNSTIVVSACKYGYGDVYTVTNEAGKTLGTVSAIGSTDGEKFEFAYSGAAATLTLTGSLTDNSGEIYIHSVTVKNAALPYTDEIEINGTCGKNANWVINNQILEINGNGEIYNYDNSSELWSDYKNIFSKVKINSGISYIGRNAFEDCDNVSVVVIPKSVTKIGDGAFAGCDENLTLCVEKGSDAERYAKSNNISYKIIGDTNSDKNVDKADVAVILKYIIGESAEVDSDVFDCNDDGKVDITDVIAISKIL